MGVTRFVTHRTAVGGRCADESHYSLHILHSPPSSNTRLRDTCWWMGGPNYVYKNIDRARGPNPSPLARFLAASSIPRQQNRESPTRRQNAKSAKRTRSVHLQRSSSCGSRSEQQLAGAFSTARQLSDRARTRRGLLVCLLPATCRRRRKAISQRCRWHPSPCSCASRLRANRRCSLKPECRCEYSLARSGTPHICVSHSISPD